MKTIPFSILDLVPKESSFTVHTMPNTPIVLKPWNLHVRAWASEKYTSKGLQEIFEKQKINEIADIAYFMLKDKTPFPTLISFLEKIESVKDQINLAKAVLGAVGIGEPEIEKINKELEKNPPPAPKEEEPENPLAQSPDSQIGATSSTP